MDVAESRPTMRITTGLGSVGVAALVAGRPSPFFHCFLSHTPTNCSGCMGEKAVEDLHLSSTAFSPIHPLQFAGALSGIATALCGALFLGRSHAYTQRPESRARFFHASPLGPRTGSLPTSSFLSPPNARPHHSLAGTRCSG